MGKTGVGPPHDLLEHDLLEHDFLEHDHLENGLLTVYIIPTSCLPLFS